MTACRQVPARLLLNVPGTSRRERRTAYESFRPLADPLFPAGLPETLDGARFLTFGSSWAPQTEKIRRPAECTPPWVAKRLKSILV